MTNIIFEYTAFKNDEYVEQCTIKILPEAFKNRC